VNVKYTHLQRRTVTLNMQQKSKPGTRYKHLKMSDFRTTFLRRHGSAGMKVLTFVVKQTERLICAIYGLDYCCQELQLSLRRRIGLYIRAGILEQIMYTQAVKFTLLEDSCHFHISDSMVSISYGFR
jgi:hypothetical protein